MFFRSIQSRLAVALCAAVILLSAITGVFTYHKLATKLLRRFDDAITIKAHAIASAVVQDQDGHLEFSLSDALMPEYRPSIHAEYFELRYANGRAFVRSRSLGDNHLPAVSPGQKPMDIRLPTGRTGRMAVLSFAPTLEDDEDQHHKLIPPVPVPLIAVVARDRADLDDGLNEISRAIAAGCIALALVTTLAVILIVRRALKPLRNIAFQASRIDAAQLDRRLPVAGLPAELQPISGRVNDLLDRLQSAFTRERRFTADVAHELRTPIAELRMLAELPLRWPDDHQIAGQSLRDVLAVARQMEQLVVVLLALARAEITGLQLHCERIELGPLVYVLAHTLTPNCPSAERLITEQLITEQLIAERSIANNAPAFPTPFLSSPAPGTPGKGRGGGSSNSGDAPPPSQRSAATPAKADNQAPSDVSRIPAARTIAERAIDVQIPADAIVNTDRALIASVLNNLLKNAVEYATGDEPIQCYAQKINAQWTLHIENAAAHLKEEMIPHLFEPFWRADPARTTGDHAGLGLSLAASYCKLLKINLTATQPAEGKLRLSLVFPSAETFGDPQKQSAATSVAAEV